MQLGSHSHETGREKVDLGRMGEQEIVRREIRNTTVVVSTGKKR